MDRIAELKAALAEVRAFIFNAPHILSAENPLDVCATCEMVRRIDEVCEAPESERLPPVACCAPVRSPDR